jgi:hypothetical protein
MQFVRERQIRHARLPKAHRQLANRPNREQEQKRDMAKNRFSMPRL